jgi:prolyl-tRNA editing enzyme YbaK/EbsC (Cys-tRNA(Pro) deacylase)
MNNRLWCLCCEIPRPLLDLASAEQHLANAHGVSLVGATPVFMDERLLEQPTILIGAGVVGVEIEIAPADLRAITQADVLPLTL